METAEDENFQMLLSMGFDPENIQTALALNDTMEGAIAWLFQGITVQQSANLSAVSDIPEEIKMVIVVRNDLRMTPGKIAAQCVHASLGAYRQQSSTNSSELAIWESTGEKTVCLKCGSDEEMEGILTKATAAGLSTYAIHDGGRTQVDPGSRTVMAIGPDKKSKIDAVTGHLKLY